jgi:hypothetical protein
MATDPAQLPTSATAVAPLAGTRSQSVQRLQIGLFGLAAMVLLVSLATIITDSARENEARVVPGAAPTVAAEEQAAPVRDPLADAGVVPADQSAPPSESQAGNAPALQP